MSWAETLVLCLFRATLLTSLAAVVAMLLLATLRV